MLWNSCLFVLSISDEERGFQHWHLDDVNNPGSRLVAEVRHGDGRRGVDGGQEPEEDDGEEAEDGEEDEDAAGVNDGADEEKQTEESEESWKRIFKRM